MRDCDGLLVKRRGVTLGAVMYGFSANGIKCKGQIRQTTEALPLDYCGEGLARNWDWSVHKFGYSGEVRHSDWTEVKDQRTIR